MSWLAATVRCSAPYDAGAAVVIGIAAVLVQAKDEVAKGWYLGQAEFLVFPEEGRVLWLPVGMVVGAVGGA